MRINFEAMLKVGIKRDSQVDAFVTYVPALKIYSQGTTLIQAKTATEDAIQSYLAVAYENGVLEKCLRAAGFTKIHPKDIQHDCGEFVSIKEENILEQEKYEDIFEIPAHLCISTATA